jgi:CubicO group peptidase (beta-lactamase class C family)
MLAGACASVPTPAGKDEAASMRSTPQLMEAALVPGLQIATIRNERIEVFPFGVADMQSRSPVTSDTVFEAASLGKPVFAYGVLRLASEGLVDLDAPIGKYLQDLPTPLRDFTPRQLLTHSTGLGNSPPPAGAAVKASSPPRFSYSGEGYNLLQRVVERLTGESIDSYMQRAVFAPLRMTSSSYVWRDDYQVRKAFSHTFTGSSAGRSRNAEAKVASSLATTAGDYARFLVAALGGTGLRPDLAREFLRPQIALEDGCVVCLEQARGMPSNRRHWTLGLGRESAAGRDFAWHWGDNRTTQSYAAIDVAGERGVVILTNSANGHSIARQLASTVLKSDAPGYAWLGSYGTHTEPVRRLLSRIVREGVSGLTPADLALPRQDLRQVAERLLEGRRPREAAELLRRIVSDGGAASEHALLAEAERKAGNFEAARIAAAMALRLEPRHAEAQQVLVRIQQAERVIPRDRLASYAGVYLSPFGELEIRNDGGRLTARLVDQPASEMLPLSDSSFFMEAMGVPIEFVEGADGAVTHAIVRAGGETRLPRKGKGR